MKISRKSWHYKIRNLGNDFGIYNDTLCRYFWAIVIRIVLITVCTAAIATLVYGYFTSPFWISTSIMILFLISSVVLPVWAVCFVRKRFGGPPELPKETLIFEYLKAKKNKVCPLIEYVD